MIIFMQFLVCVVMCLVPWAIQRLWNGIPKWPFLINLVSLQVCLIILNFVLQEVRLGTCQVTMQNIPPWVYLILVVLMDYWHLQSKVTQTLSLRELQRLSLVRILL